MQKIENHFEVLKILKKELPNCFRQGNKKLPLSVGIHESICRHYEKDDRFDRLTLKRGIGFYCKGKKYLNAVILGASRIDMNGRVVSTVTKAEQKHALKILNNRKKFRKSIENIANTP